MRKGATQLLLLIVLLVCLVDCVDRSRFKTCKNSGFCSRNRDYAKAEGISPYYLLEDTISQSEGHFSADVRHKENDQNFHLTITEYEHNIIRVQLTEKNPLHHRYSPPGVILPSAKTTHNHPQYNNQDDLIFGKVRLQNSPLSFDFFSGDEKVISANSRGLFNIEHYRVKELTEEVDAEHLQFDHASPYRRMGNDRAWSESFGGHTDNKPHGPSSVGCDFTFHGSQHVYGIPEHASSFSLKSTTSTDPYRLYNLDVFEYELRETMALYGSIPLMISHRKGQTAAVFWFNPSETWIDIEHKQNPDQVDTHWFSESGNADFFVLLGPTPKEVFVQYTYLTGTQELPPEFAIAYHQCRWNYKDEDDVKTVHSKFDEYDLPFDVIWLDIEHTHKKKYFTWDPIKFPTPEKMIAAVAEKGRRMVTIVDPHILKESGYHIYDGGSANDYWVKRAEGGSYEGHCWPGTSMYLDFSNPAVREYWADQYSLSNYRGSSLDLFTWNDMNEPSVFNGPEVTMPKDLIHYGDVEHRELHNAFGMWVHQGTHDGLIARSGKLTPQRSFVLSRAFFAGSQRFGAIWTGDNTANWEHLQASTPMLLSISVAGISFCGADVGGFFGNPEEELLVRWYQAGAYQPFFRAHAHLDTKRREPYLFSENSIQIIREALRARYRLLPFWYTEFYNSFVTGLPVMRPLWVEYPDDSNTFSIEDQYLIGSDLLVKPQTLKMASSLPVYFPEGSNGWYDFATYEFFATPGNVNVPTPLDKIPVYQRAGSIIARKDRARRSSSQMKEDPYTLVVALNADQTAEGTLYADDGLSFDYHDGEFIHRKFVWKNNKLVSYNLNRDAPPFPTNVVVERIIVLGLKTPYTSALVEQQQFSLTAQILQQTSPSGEPVYIIKKPTALIAYDWQITFNE